MSVGEMVNAARSRWKVIEHGEPSAEIHTTTANAVPNVGDWQALNGAMGPKVIWMRRWGTVNWPADQYVTVDFTIYLKFEYGATYRGGGLFIPNIYVEVPASYAGWRYDVDVDIDVAEPVNDNTRVAPIARVPVAITGTISNPFWSSSVDWAFTLYGTGRWVRQ